VVKTREALFEERVDAARAEHGRLVTAEVRGRAYVFRPMTVAEALDVAQRLERAPAVALPTAIDAARACCLNDPAEFDEAADNFPLAFSAESGVCEQLLKLASEDAAAAVKGALSRWRNAERQLGVVAEDLLAFKAYTGGVAGEKEIAGALHIAEHLDTMKGLYKLHLSFMRALAKRRG
jgi:hypothetical protein